MIIGTNFFSETSNYFCLECDVSGSFEDVVNHWIEHHAKSPIAVHKKILCEGTGEKTRLELDFGVIPSDIADSGLTLVIDSASENINVFIKPYNQGRI